MMTFTNEMTKALSAPLDRSHVKSRSQAGRSLSYIEGWHAIAEANRIFGFGGWNRILKDIRQLGEPREIDGKWRVAYMATVTVTVGDVTRDGTGYGSGIDRDLGSAHESALKEAETDAMKRALMTFGNPFGLALYDKDQANVVDAPAYVFGAVAPNGVSADLWSTAYARAESGTAAFTAWAQNDATTSEKAMIGPFKVDLWEMAKAADAKAQEAA